jgi:tRNA(Ile)-lysidine synthase TilS/MesJ
MDTSDSSIYFDHRGWCNYCCAFESKTANDWHPGQGAILSLKDSLKKIENVSNSCLIVIDGGLDSSFAAYIAHHTFGLNPTLFYFDDGWGSEIGLNNAKEISRSLGLNFVSLYPNYKILLNLQLQFFKASVPYINCASELYKFILIRQYCKKNNIKLILSSHNLQTESFKCSVNWEYFFTDTTFINAIQKKFSFSLFKFPNILNIYYNLILDRLNDNCRHLSILNYILYNKCEASEILTKNSNWKSSSRLHFQSNFEYFLDCYWLPKKFGIDKRRAILSSEILTGQLHRSNAIRLLAISESNSLEFKEMMCQISLRFGISLNEMREIFILPNKTYRDFKNSYFLMKFISALSNRLGIKFPII